MSRIIDLSCSMDKHMPCYPGDPEMTLETAKNIKEHGCEVTRISLGSHTGPHVDAPSHMIDGGKSLSDLDLSSFSGRAVKVSLSQNLDEVFEIFQVDGVILETGWGAHFSTPDIYYGPGRPSIPRSFAEALAKRKIKFFGCDLPSVDPSGSGEKAVHMTFLSNDIPIYENLANLDQLPENTPFMFMGFPLNIQGIDGSPVRAVATLCDSADCGIQSAEKRLGQARDLLIKKDQFLAHAAHEIRNLLNGAMAISESLMDGAAGALNGEQSRHLSMVVDCGNRMGHLLNNILDFSRMKNARLDLYIQPIHVRGVVESVMALFEPIAQDKSILLVNDIPENAPLVDADENRLRQILHNLIGNAVKFTREGEIRASVSKENRGKTKKRGAIRVSIADSGIGIPIEKQGRIFQSFEQAHGSTAGDDNGVGLGLAVARNLVEAHGGELILERSGDLGSVFSFTLPVASDQTKKMV